MLLLADTTSECLPKAFVGLMYFLFIRRSPSTYFHLLFLYFLFSSDAVTSLSPNIPATAVTLHISIPFLSLVSITKYFLFFF